MSAKSGKAQVRARSKGPSVEVIIPVRRERYDDLARTLAGIPPHVAVCVVYDDAPTWAEKVKRPAGGDMRVLRHETPQGPGRCRHEAIISSASDTVILVDAHMQFPDGDWTEAFRRRLALRPQEVVCCQTRALDANWEALREPVQRACCLDMFCHDVRYGEQVRLLVAARWEKGQASGPGPVQAVMGACYGFTRWWYDTMGQPLRLTSTWGGDEELLSLGSHLMGGGCYLLPLTVGHVYKAHGGHLPAVTTEEKDRERQLQWCLTQVIPCTAEERNVAVAWLQRNLTWPKTLGVDWPAARKAEVEAVKAAWSGASLTWGELLKSGQVNYSMPAELSRPQVVVRPREVCARCGAEMPFRQLCGLRAHDGFSQAYARCKKCGLIAHVRQM